MKPRSYRSVLAVILLGGALAAAGCGKSTSPTNPNTALDQTSADDIAVQTQFALDQMGLDVYGARSFVTSPGTPARVRPLRVMWDTTVTIGTLTADVSLNFYDAQDQALAAYGPEAVKLLWTSHIYGSLTTERDTATAGHAGSLDLRGIQPADTAFTLNCTALDTLLNKFRSYDGTRTRYFYWNSSLAGTDVVWGKAHEWPWSGTLTFTVRADRLRSWQRGDVEAHLNATVVVTFNGTGHPDVVVNGTWHYQWDMTNGTMIRV